MSIKILRDMFAVMVVDKDASAIGRFYDPDFEMFSNGVTQGYESFRLEHEKVYNTEIQYAVEFDEDAWVDAGDRVAARVWITTKRPEEPETRIEVILIATFKSGRIYRIWETTWPSWTDLEAFKNYQT